MNPEVNAQVVLRPASGSAAAPGEPVTAENVDRFAASKDAIQDASRWLRQMGVSVGPGGPTSISIQCDKAVFERIFGTSLEAAGSVVGAYYRAARPIRVPDELRPFVSEVVLAEPPALFP